MPLYSAKKLFLAQKFFTANTFYAKVFLEKYFFVLFYNILENVSIL